MDYPSSLWDLSVPALPQQLPPIDDSDFLTILSKQLNPTATAHPPNPPNPQTLIQDLSPPSSEDSASPSPPAAADRGLAKQTDSSDRNQRDDMRKRIRQANSDDEDDDIEGQPHSKSQKEEPGKKGSKRKSGGADEGRALKRKEQNRAAQRAFRERKEKHVKDLEDQVAALEAKSTSQSTENENLRELLGRLQNENLMLKQSAFTFNLSSAGTPRSTAAVTNRPTPSASSPASSLNNKSVSTPSSVPAPTPTASSPSGNQPLGLTTGAGYTPLLSFNTLGNGNTNTNSNKSVDDTNLISMMSSNNSPPLTFFSPPPTSTIPSPYTTIASNPMYTSYTDLSAWDQFFADVALDQTLAGVTMPQHQDSGAGSSGSSLPTGSNSNNSGGMEDLFQSTGNFPELIPFSTFSPTGSPSNGFGNMMAGAGSSTITAASSPIDHTVSRTSNPQENVAFSLASREVPINRPTIQPPPRSSSPCGGADADEAPLPGSSHYASASSSGPTHADRPFCTDDNAKCPTTKEEVARFIEGQPISTMGTVPGAPPPMTSSEKQIKLKEVWATLKNHPRFEECDMDELCRELSAKVKCDGSMPVIDKPCEELEKLIDSVKAKKAEEKAEAKAKATPFVGGAAVSLEALQQHSKLFNGGPAPQLPSPTTTATMPPGSNDLAAMFNPYNSFLPFALDQQPQQSRPSLSTSTDSTDSMGSSISALPTPASANSTAAASMFGNLDGQQIQMQDPQQPQPMDTWMSDLVMDMPSPGSQFLSYLSGSGSLGSFSPNAYLNLTDKE